MFWVCSLVSSGQKPCFLWHVLKVVKGNNPSKYLGNVACFWISVTLLIHPPHVGKKTFICKSRYCTIVVCFVVHNVVQLNTYMYKCFAAKPHMSKQAFPANTCLLRERKIY